MLLWIVINLVLVSAIILAGLVAVAALLRLAGWLLDKLA